MRRALLLLCLASCGDTGQEHVALALQATGVASQAIAVGDASLTLTRAQVAFGPAYFCASEAGRAELCEVAVAEYRQTALIDALNPAPQSLGELEGTTGEVRSAIYDYGISWLLTENKARANIGAPSALIEGTVTRAAQTLSFRAQVDITPRLAGDLAVNGQVTRYVISERSSALTLALDPRAWVSSLDIDALFALDGDADGVVVIPSDSVLYESILQGMLNRAPVRFTWN